MVWRPLAFATIRVPAAVRIEVVLLTDRMGNSAIFFEERQLLGDVLLSSVTDNPRVGAGAFSGACHPF